MELDEFVAEATTSLVRGIMKGLESDVGEFIAPLIQGEQRQEAGIFNVQGGPPNQATIVRFDIQVAASRKAEGDAKTKGKARLFVVDLEVGGGGKVTTDASNLHRMQFSVPVKIPTRDSGG